MLCRYVRRLQKRYMPDPHLDPDGEEEGAAAAAAGGSQQQPQQAPSNGPPSSGGSGDRSLSVPVVFVSLLRKGTPDKDRSETKLASAFDFVSGHMGQK